MAEQSESTLNFRRIAKRTTAIALGLAILPGCGGEDNKADSAHDNSSTISETPLFPESLMSPAKPQGTLSLGRRVIEATAICESLPDGGPEQKALDRYNLVVVDSRCDAATETSVSIYPEPTQESESMDQFITGDALPALCLQGGQFIRNVRDDGDFAWVRVKSEEGAGYIPRTWVQAGKGLENC